MSLSAAVLILNWNGKPLLETCLPGLCQQTNTNYQLVVIDNGSTDGSLEFMRAKYPQIQCILFSENLGFSRAYNQALAQIDTNVVVFLNNDVSVPAEWLTRLLAPFAVDDTIGIVGCKLLYPDEKTLQHAGGALRMPQAHGIHLHYGEPDEGQADLMLDVDYVTGAAMAVRHSVLTQIGTFDDIFSPYYFEEVDLCYRARAAGFRVIYNPDAVAVHHESLSMVTVRAEQFRAVNLNRLRFLLKHLSVTQFLEEFVPAETEWLQRHLPEHPEEMALQQVYLEFFLDLPRLTIVWDKEASLAILQMGVLHLRDAALLANHAADGDDSLDRFSDLVKRQELRPAGFSSDAPLVGSAVAAFRQAWNDVSTTWYVQPLIEQQSIINTLVVQILRAEAAEGKSTALDVNVLAESMNAVQVQLVALTKELHDVQNAVVRLESFLAQTAAVCDTD